MLKQNCTALVAWAPAACPERCNYCRQDPLQCGFFVGWWQEEEIRHCRGEGWCSRGYPKILGAGGTRETLHAWMKALQPVATQMVKDVKLLKETEEKEHADYDAAVKAATAAAGEVAKSLEAKAIEALQRGERGVDMVFDVDAEGGLEAWADAMLESKLLMEDHDADCRRVKEFGLGVCSSCQWTVGCRRCYWPKTVRYWRFKEMRGELLEGYAPLAKAMAKGKGRGGGVAKAKPAAKAKAEAKAKAAAKPAAKPKAKGKDLRGGGSFEEMQSLLADKTRVVFGRKAIITL